MERVCLKPYELIALRTLGSVALKGTCGLVHGVLASNPGSLVNVISLTAARTNGLRIAESIFNQFRINLALTANDFGHDATCTGDSARTAVAQASGPTTQPDTGASGSNRP